jgi:hypothetical protein
MLDMVGLPISPIQLASWAVFVLVSLALLVSSCVYFCCILETAQRFLQVWVCLNSFVGEVVRDSLNKEKREMVNADSLHYVLSGSLTCL